MSEPMRHSQLAKKERSGTRVGYAAWVCPFEFKMLRVIMVLSEKIAARRENCRK